MSKCYNSTKDIVNALPALSSFLIDAGSYFAHLPKGSSKCSNETLEEHVNLVNDYFTVLIEEHRLDVSIDNLIRDYIKGEERVVGEYLKQLFVHTIFFHDFGKVNEYFQFEKMKNTSFANKLKAGNVLGSSHSALSAYLYLAKHLHEIVTEHQFNPRLVTACIYLSYSIFKHHGSRFGDDSSRITNFADIQAKYDFSDVSKFLDDYLQQFGYYLNPNVLQIIGKNEWLKNNLKFTEKNSFSLYALCRLNFSLLTASDYLATNEYMNRDAHEYNNNTKISDFGTLTKKRIEEIYQQVSQDEWIDEAIGKRNYNKTVFEKIDDYTLTYPTEASGENLNALRTEMAIEVIRNVRANADQNLFYIEAPTGGGKTNLSALAAIELLKIHEGNYNKVFYVFPFTTLITQTYHALKETLGLKDHEMVELHSNAGMKLKHGNEDDQYGSDKLNYIHLLFVNYPFAFLSHIRFFDILKTNEKETNYLLHRLANSIVIIDELQSYNPEHWDKVIYFVKQYAAQFNIKFILMSATLPKLDKLNVIKDNVQEFVYLLDDKIVVDGIEKKKYFTNPNFAGRVRFDFELFNRTDLQLQELKEKLLSESEKYATKDFGTAKPLGSVYTIIEFIFKKSASEFHALMELTNDFFDEIFLLSGTILPHRRKYIINYLKNKSNRQKKVLLITTQVVEAGVDIDMDLGFKDRSLLDSDEQLAGRINRNVTKNDCKLFLFNYNKESLIYGKDKRLELTKSKITIDEYQRILENKNFDFLYDLVLNNRNEWNRKEMAINFTDYESHINHLRFQSVHHEFKLIEQNNISCFIPLAVPVAVKGYVDGNWDSVFTQSELAFLKTYDVYPNDENAIEGAEVFDIYLLLIDNKQEFIKHKTDEKILQGIMSKFVFSIFATDAIKQKLIEYSDQEKTKSEFGYQYIEFWKDIYSIESGMNDQSFNSNETQFL